VGYLIVDLGERRQQDVHRFLRDVEGGLIAALECLGLRTRRIDGMTGVFVADDGPPRKIASIGLGLRGWVTWHGFALNVSLDLAGFDSIVPCGLQGVEMTSVAQELDAAECGSALDLRARSAVGAAFSQLL
jgi:lipoate-protein ligase B